MEIIRSSKYILTDLTHNTTTKWEVLYNNITDNKNTLPQPPFDRQVFRLDGRVKK